MQITTVDSKEKLKVSDDVFKYPYNEGLIHQVVVSYMSNARTDKSCQKTRSEVSGGGKKPWAQKGTGRARAGTIRSPLWRTGGVTFASKLRNYFKKVNKKMYVRAIRSIISELLRQKKCVVISEFNLDTHKTKDFINKMCELKIDNALIIKDELTENDVLAPRNTINFDICDTQQIDQVALLRFEMLVITEKALLAIEEQLK